MGASEYAGLMAVVTGGASGTGLATARLIAAHGARVACLGLKPDDVTVGAAVEDAARRLGGIDILIDNAGIGAQGSIEGNTRRRMAPASRWTDVSPPTTSPAPSRTSRARSPVPPQVLISPSTAACTDHASGPAPDLPHETVGKENQP